MSRRVVRIDSECLTARILADHLREMIERAGSTPEHVAACLGKDPDTIRNWTRGVNLASTIAVLNAFEVLGCRIRIDLSRPARSATR